MDREVDMRGEAARLRPADRSTASQHADHPAPPTASDRIVGLQRSAGNHAVQRMLGTAARPAATGGPVVVQRDLAAYAREHVEVDSTDMEGPSVLETTTADAPGITAALGALTAAGKINARPVSDMVQFSPAAGVTRTEIIAALTAASYPRAAAMADALLDPHRIALYSREEVRMIPGVIWDTILGRSGQNLDTQTTRGLTGAERAAATTVFGGSIDYDRIVLDDAPLMGIGGYARTTPWTINFPNGTLAAGGPDMSWLIHELGHSWEYQRGVSLATTLYHAIRGVYDYGGEAALRSNTAAGRGLSAFNTEQQADIAKDAYELVNGLRTGTRAVYQPYIDEFRSGAYR